MKVFMLYGYDMVCRGDEHDFCDKCKARFGCYTGELPDSIMYRDGKRIPFLKTLEWHLLGFYPNEPILGNAIFDKQGNLDFAETMRFTYQRGLKNDTV